MKNDLNILIIKEMEDNMKSVQQIFGKPEGKSLIIMKLQEKSHVLGSNLGAARSIVELYFTNGTLF
jgi:hypothetical protein